MQKVLIFLVIFQFSCLLSGTVSAESSWVLATDFKPEELANLTSLEEHRLLLKSLWKKRASDFISLGPTIYWEVLAKSVGIEFCGLVEDEKVNREISAVIRALFECTKKLDLQDDYLKVTAFTLVLTALENLYSDELFFLDKFNVPETFTKSVMNFNDLFENDTCFAEHKNKFMKDSEQPTKKYLYGIPKTEAAYKKELADFVNDPQIKSALAHFIYLFHSDDAEKKWPAKNVLRSLAEDPKKLSVVQSIYDESIIKIVSMMEDVSPDQVDLDQLYERDFEELETILYRVLRKKILANDDLRKQIMDWQSPLCSPTQFL